MPERRETPSQYVSKLDGLTLSTHTCLLTSRASGSLLIACYTRRSAILATQPIGGSSYINTNTHTSDASSDNSGYTAARISQHASSWNTYRARGNDITIRSESWEGWSRRMTCPSRP